MLIMLVPCILVVSKNNHVGSWQQTTVYINDTFLPKLKTLLFAPQISRCSCGSHSLYAYIMHIVMQPLTPVEYLCHLIDAARFHPLPSKLHSIVSALVPASVQQLPLRSLLLKVCSQPLHCAKTTKSVAWYSQVEVWTAECDHAFTLVKDNLVSFTLWHYPTNHLVLSQSGFKSVWFTYSHVGLRDTSSHVWFL